MLHDGACSIYEHRPRTCRTYDCRVFAATGTVPDVASQPAIAAQVARWRFRCSTAGEEQALAAMHAAAGFLRANPGLLRDAGIPHNPTQIAVAAVALGELFAHPRSPDPATVAAALRHWVRGG
jgi:hypothetical protein